MIQKEKIYPYNISDKLSEKLNLYYKNINSYDKRSETGLLYTRKYDPKNDSKLVHINKIGLFNGVQANMRIKAWSSGKRSFSSSYHHYINEYSYQSNFKSQQLGFRLVDMEEEIETYSYCNIKKKYARYKSINITRSDLDIDYLMKSNPDILLKINEFCQWPDWEGDKEIFGGQILTLLWTLFNKTDKDKERLKKFNWAYNRKWKMERGVYTNGNDLIPHYITQNELRKQISITNEVPENTRYIAGVDIGYDELTLSLVTSVVLYDLTTTKIIDRVLIKEEVDYHYLQDLFSWRESELIVKAFKKLTKKPDLILCHGHGIDHPLGIGTASQIGIELNTPVIACTRKRLIGMYDRTQLGVHRGDKQSLTGAEGLGFAIRIQSGQARLFINIGHKIDLQNALSWIMKLTQNSYFPIPLEEAIQLANEKMKNRSELDYMNDCGIDIFDSTTDSYT